MSDEVEVCDDAFVVSQTDHFHAAESSQFEEDLPLLLGWTVDYCVLNCQKMTELVVEEARTLLFSLESQLEAVCALLDEQLWCYLADLSIYQLFSLVSSDFYKHEIGVLDARRRPSSDNQHRRG